MIPTDYKLITTPEELRAAVEELRQNAVIGFDTETTDLDPYRGRLRLVQLAAPDGVRIIDLDRFSNGDLKRSEALAPLRELLSAPRPVKIGHNLKFDSKWAKHSFGVELGGLFDTLLASQIVSAGDMDERHGLEAVASRYLSETIDKAERLSDWSGELSEAQLQYASMDAAVLTPLREKLIERLKSDALLKCAQLEFECVLPVASLELAGIYLDKERWREQLAVVEKKRAALAEELQQMLAEESPQQSLFGGPTRLDINLDSHVQLTKALTRLGIPVPDSTRNWKLQPLAADYPVIRKLLEYRTVQKALTSYGENILEEINPVTGRIHANFHQIGAPTGRFACLAGDSLVPTFRGFKRMDALRQGDLVKTSHGFKRVEKAWMTGERRLYKVLLRDGRSIRSTGDHRFLTGSGDEWKSLDDLRPGDRLYVSLKGLNTDSKEQRCPIEINLPNFRSRKPVSLPSSLSVELCELMGLIVADGFLSKRHERPVSKRRPGGLSALYDRIYLAFGHSDQELIDVIVGHSLKLFGQPFTEVKSRTCRVFQLASTRAAQFLAALGLCGNAHTKSVPEIILSAPALYQSAFLRGLFEGDGHRSDHHVGLTSVNRQLLSFVQMMLSNLGIYSSVHLRKDQSGFAGSDRFDLSINKKSDITRFMEQVGFISTRKARPFNFFRQSTDGIPTPYKVSGASLYKEAVAAGTTEASRKGVKPFVTHYKDSYIKGESVEKLINRFGMLPSLKPISSYLKLEIRPVEIEAIIPDTKEKVYDLMVEDVHEFIANGIVVHNCTNPNIQQVPHSIEYRRCFRAPEGRKLVISDYCVAAGTRVATRRGLLMIEDVRADDEVYLEDGSTAAVSATIRRGKLPTVTITLKNGYSLTATSLHRIRVIDGDGRYVWRRIGELKKTDFVAVQPSRGLHDDLPYVELPEVVREHHNNHKNLSVPRYADERLSVFMGYIAGDGTMRRNVIGWVVNSQDAEVFRFLNGLASELFDIPVHNRGMYRGVHEAGLYSVPLVKWCLEVGMSKHCVPRFLWRSKPSVVAAYLRGLFESDGSVTDSDTGKVSFASSRRQLAVEVHQLLLALGIPATLREQRNTGPDKRFNCWSVSIVASGLQNFSSQVGFLSERKRAKLRALMARQTGKTVVGNMPNLQAKIRALHLSGEARRLLNNSSSLGRPVSAVLARTLESAYPDIAHSLGLRHITGYKQLFLPVVKIELADEREVFDLSVPGPMTYISDGFVSHNSQIELRILADFTGDKGFVDAFNSGADLHRVTAAQVFNVPLEQVTKEQRDFAKRLNFGVVYGIGAQRFSMMTGLTLSDAEGILQRYFATYRQLDAWLRDAANRALRERTARTASGRLARFRFDSEDRQAASLAQRNGKNTPVQGCLHKGARIMTTEHGYIPIEEAIYQEISIWDGRGYVSAAVIPSGLKRLVKIELWGGYYVECSPDHKFWAIDANGRGRWLTAEELAEHKQIYVDITAAVPDWELPLNLKVFEPKDLKLNHQPVAKPHNAKLLSLAAFSDNFKMGLWIGRLASDGSVTRLDAKRPGNITLMVAEHEEVILPELEIMTSTFGHFRKRTRITETQPGAFHSLTVGSISLTRQLIHYGIKERIPDFLWRSKSALRGYLRGMFDGDGTVNMDGPVLTFGKGPDIHLDWARQIQQALLLFGVRSRINRCSDRINVRVLKRDAHVFAEQIGFMNPAKQAKLATIVPQAYVNDSHIYGRAVRVKSVEITDDWVEMYDVVNSASQQFMANGMITHNSSADILKRALRLLHEKLRDTSACIVNIVHDEIVVEANADETEAISRKVEDAMCAAGEEYVKKVPIKVETQVSDEWVK